LVALDSLDMFYKNTVAVGLRVGAQDEGNCLYELFSAMRKCVPSKEVVVEEDGLGSEAARRAAAIKAKKERKKIPSFDVSKHHLKKIGDDFLAFTPSSVSASVQKVDDFGSDFLGVSSLSELEISEDVSFDYRTKPSKKPKIKREPLEQEVLGNVKVDGKADQGLINFAFTLDTEGEDTKVASETKDQLDSMRKSVKRKGSYKQAKVLRLIGNPNKKKKNK